MLNVNAARGSLITLLMYIPLLVSSS